MSSSLTKFQAVAFLLGVACSSATIPMVPGPPPPPPAGTLRIMFVGNSLTNTFDIPGQVVSMAGQAGLPRPITDNYSVDGYSLEDHWNAGQVRAVLGIGTPYDVLVLQQGPSTLESSGINLTEFAGKFAAEARKYGTRPAVYVVWPPLGGDLDAGTAHHEAAATAANAALYPVGEAWKLAWAADPQMPLYGEDQFHPSEHGSWLAALVMVAMIYDKPVASFSNLFPDKISAAQEATLREAARIAIRDHGVR